MATTTTAPQPATRPKTAPAAPTKSASTPTTSASAPTTSAGAPAKVTAKPPAKRRAVKPPAKPAKPARPPMFQRLAAQARGLRFRLLPVTIFVAVLMLGLRVGDLWRVVARDARLPEFPVTLAESPPAKGPAQPASPPAPAEPPADAAKGKMAAIDPLGPVENQELLKHYAERREELDRTQRDIEQREALLAAAEKRIDEKLHELEKVRTEIQKLLGLGNQRQSEQLESLVKIYETMKPKEAARIFEEMDMPVLLDVIQRMKETKTAPILAAMDPVKAKEVTSALVERRTLPTVPQ